MVKSIKKMTANNSKSYRGYLNKLIDEYNDTYLRPIEIETNPKAPRSKDDDRVWVITYKYIFSKDYTRSWSKEISVIEPVLKINTWAYELNDLKRETVIGSFYQKELLFNKL